MAQKSYPFDGGDGAYITETEWSRLVGSYQDNGVICEGPWETDLKVIGDGSPSTAWVSPGRAIIEGVHFESDTDIPVAFNANTDANYDRMDLVVLRLDRDENRVVVAVRQGMPSPTPVAPTPDTTGAMPEIPLARVLVRRTIPNIDSGDIQDARPFVGRRIRIGDSPAELPRGTIAYEPTRDRWVGVRATAVADLAFVSDATSAASTAIQAHESASDPHTQYLTQARGDARYSLASHTHPAASVEKVLVRQTATLSAPNGSVLPFSTAVHNPSGMWSSSASTQITFPTAGLYLAMGYGQVEYNANGQWRTLVIRHSTQGVLAEDNKPFTGAEAIRLQPSALCYASAGSHIRLECWHDAGGSVSLSDVWFGAFRIA